jgi:hypothetical protein
MGESEKFVRHIIPGLVFMIFSALQIYSFLPEKTIKLLTDTNASLAIIGVFTLGGIGYVFSNIYFTTSQMLGYHVSHKAFLEKIDGKFILIKNSENEILKAKDISEDGIWGIINTIWHSILDKKDVESAITQVNRMSHIVHGNGINIVSLSFSLLLSFILFFSLECTCAIIPYMFSVICTVFFLFLVCLNYRLTKKRYYSFVNSSVLNGIQRELEKKEDDLLIIYYSE